MAAPSEAQLVEARTIALHAAKRQLGTSPDEADDVAQMVLVAFLDQDVDLLTNWRGWVARAARNRAIDQQRRSRDGYWDSERFEGSAPPKKMRSLGPSATGMWPSIWETLTATLNETEREMLLASLDGASNAEIATDFGYANANTVGVTLSRLRGKVRAAFVDRERVLDLLGVQRLY